MSFGVGIGIGMQFPMGGAGGLSSKLAQLTSLDIVNANVDRNSTRTVSAYATAAVIADGESLVTIAIDEPALEGYRYLGAGNGWSTVDADGVALPDLRGLSVGISGNNSSTDDDRWDEPTPSLWAVNQLAGVHTFTPVGTAAVGTVLGSYVDATNHTKIHFDGTNIKFTVTVAGAPTEATFAYATTAGTECEVQYEYDGADLRVFAKDSIDVDPAFAETAFVGSVPLNTTIGIGNDNNGASILQAVNPSPVFKVGL